MIVDSSDSCNMINFGLGSSSTTSRQWDIKGGRADENIFFLAFSAFKIFLFVLLVTQYACGDPTAGTKIEGE